MNISIYDFTDYRYYLKCVYNYRKSRNSGFSYRVICDKVGIKSTGHLTLILQGKANISLELALKFAEFLELKKRETDYFQYMVLFNQAGEHEDKRKYFEKMAKFRESSVYLIDTGQYEYFSKWHHSAIRALLEFVPIKEEFAEIASLLTPSLRVDEVKRSIELMERLSLIEKDAEGFFRPVDNVIDTGTDVRSLAINNYLFETMELARDAINRFPTTHRRHSWVTLGISEDGFRAVVQEIREMRKRIYEIALHDTADSVYQLNVQLFPLSKRSEKRKRC